MPYETAPSEKEDYTLMPRPTTSTHLPQAILEEVMPCNMRGLLLLATLLITTPQVARADLGEADITGASGDTTTGRSFEARCGAGKDKCIVGFKDGRLVVNNKGGIYRDQFKNVVKERVCSQRSLLLPWVTSCFENQYDINFTITYDNDEGQRRSALISFMPRYLATDATDRAREFERDLQIWIEDVLRPIGPSIRIEGPRAEPPSRRPKREALVPTCKPPLATYQCNWSQYLEANPSVKAWAEANPVPAEKEKIRLGATD